MSFLRWVIGWFTYPFIIWTDPGNGSYHDARIAIHEWLHSFPPSEEKRLRAHEMTREPEGGW